MMRKSFMFLALSGAAALALLTGCGSQSDGKTAKTNAADVSAEIPFSDMIDGEGNFKSEYTKQQLTEKYDTYINSYLSEVGDAVHDDMGELAEEINEIAGPDDAAEWCRDYREFYEKLQHRENEINAAQMIAPESMAEKHKNLAYSVYALGKVCEYVEPYVTEAENGEPGLLKESAATFTEGYKAALTLYEHAAGDFGNTAK